MVKLKNRQSSDDGGVHLAIDFSQGSALTWVAAELAVALTDIGQKVSIPLTKTLSPTIEKRLIQRLTDLISEKPYQTYQIKHNHYWPQFLMQEVSGLINAELFVTNYRFRGNIHPLDMWSRNLVCNGLRKLPMSKFCQDSLCDIGVQASQCGVVTPGYSPEIETLFSNGKPTNKSNVRRILIVTNSHDLYRYGTDILISAIAKAYKVNDPVEIHIKDYGSSSGSKELRKRVDTQRIFPKVVWHEDFLIKEDLLKLYSQMDLMVSPFRGEGYAMKIIDAMAMGLPVLMPAFGGPLEYSPMGSFLPLEYDEINVGKCYDTDNYLVGPGAYWCQVREDSLIDSLRLYLSNPVYADNVANVARNNVYKNYTWENTAKSLLENLSKWRHEIEASKPSQRRRIPLPLSVIIPTKDRPAELAKTLAGYAAQNDQSFEIVIVNDHGDKKTLCDVVNSCAGRMRVRVMENNGKPGPGAARNNGLNEVDGDIVLITGDDIIPEADLIAHHRNAHLNYTESVDAFVGRVDWHPDINRTWFLDHIMGPGGQQFNYLGLNDQQEVPFDRFYTSNISWKRELTQDLDKIFSEEFRYAAYEDIELGYRLSFHGLKLRYLMNAVGYHLHPMTIRLFFERMRRVGKMRTVLSGMHPYLVGIQDLSFYQELEIERRRRIEQTSSVDSSSWEQNLEPLVKTLENLDTWINTKTKLSGASAIMNNELESKISILRSDLFDFLCDTYQQIGQAEEWALDSHELVWAPEWIAMLRMAQRNNAPLKPTRSYNTKKTEKERDNKNSPLLSFINKASVFKQFLQRYF